MITKSSLRVVLFSQKVDDSDWLQSFTVDWIRSLAERVERLDVVALECRSASLPDNVHLHSLGKENGAGRFRQLLTFENTVRRLAPQTDVFFGHLTPRYTWLAAPFAALYHVPQCLWYTHNHAGPELRLALATVRWILTASKDSFPILSGKVRVMGHGVDAERFTPGDAPPDDPPLVLAVGRIAPIKHHHILLEAAAHLRDQGIEARFAVAGGAPTEEGKRYQAQLLARAAELNMGDRFTLLGPLHGTDLVAVLRRASIVTNLSPVGLFDKAALEAMMTARPVIVTNPDFLPLLGDDASLLMGAAPDDLASICEKLAGLLTMTRTARCAIGDRLRARAVEQHGLGRLMDNIVALWENGR